MSNLKEFCEQHDGVFYYAINDENGVYVGEADTLEKAKENALKIKETQELADEFDFGMALHLLKAGQKVARKGWNGAGQFVYYVPANKYPADQNPNSPIKGHFENDEVPYRAYLALKTAQNDVATWQPSISDVLADDWVIVE